MPFKIVKQNQRWCVYTIDPNGDPLGATHGCHDSREQAMAQLRQFGETFARERLPVLRRLGLAPATA